jgi:hypothetical protein
MTDEISFQVPVLLASLALRNIESALVCLHPEMIRPLVEGLYVEHNRVVLDFLEDWHLGTNQAGSFDSFGMITPSRA